MRLDGMKGGAEGRLRLLKSARLLSCFDACRSQVIQCGVCTNARLLSLTT